MTILEQIKAKEQTLLQAMLKSDAQQLDNLISEDLIFTDHTGRVLKKADDIEAHRSGKISIKSIEASEQVIKIYGNTAIVSVLVKINGEFMNQPFEGSNRFSRVWLLLNDSWKIVAGHSCIVND